MKTSKKKQNQNSETLKRGTQTNPVKAHTNQKAGGSTSENLRPWSRTSGTERRRRKAARKEALAKLSSSIRNQETAVKEAAKAQPGTIQTQGKAAREAVTAQLVASHVSTTGCKRNLFE